MLLSGYSSPIRVAQAAFRHGMSVRGGKGATVISAGSKTTTKYTRPLNSRDGYTQTYMPHGLLHGKMPAGGAGVGRTVSRGRSVLISDEHSIHTFSRVADLRKQRAAPRVSNRVLRKKAAKVYQKPVARPAVSGPRMSASEWRVQTRKAVQRFAKVADLATPTTHAPPSKEHYTVLPRIAVLHSPPVAIAGVAPMQLGTLTTEGNAEAQMQAMQEVPELAGE